MKPTSAVILPYYKRWGEKKQKIIKEGFNLELDKLRTFKDNSVRELLEIESRERENTGIKTLKVGYNNVFGYYIEVSKSFKDNVPYYYERRQTIANGERFVTQELRDLEYKILTSESQAEVLELEIYNKIKGVLLENVPKLKKTADAKAKSKKGESSNEEEKLISLMEELKNDCKWALCKT